MSYWKHEITGVEWDRFKLWQREAIFQRIVLGAGEDFGQPPLCIAWEDPEEPDAPMKVTHPSPVWWAMALHGGILPPVEMYHELYAEQDAYLAEHGSLDGYRVSQRIRDYHHETQPMPPMKPEEAMSYLVRMVLPFHVWRDYRGNRTLIRIVPRESIPTDRTNRNAWRLKEIAA